MFKLWVNLFFFRFVREQNSDTKKKNLIALSVNVAFHCWYHNLARMTLDHLRNNIHSKTSLLRVDSKHKSLPFLPLKLLLSPESDLFYLGKKDFHLI